MANERGHIQPDPIFKGCTRPAMLGGVPMAPLIVVALFCFLIGIWGLAFMQSLLPPLFGAALFFSLFLTMRGIARKDDQRFKQIFLYIILRKANKSKRFWRVTSYSPFRYKRR